MMRWMLCGVLVSVVLLGLVGHVGAQDIASMDDSVWMTLYPYRGERLDAYLFKYNICVEDFITANADLLGAGYINLSPWQFPDQLWSLEIRNDWSKIAGPFYIPQHAPCYQSYQVTPDRLMELEKTLNVCVEEFYFWGRPVDEAKTVYIRYDSLPCVNEQGERLQFYESFYSPLPQPYYSHDRFTDDPHDIERYCVADLARANPGWYVYWDYGMLYSSWVHNVRLFIPDAARLCRPIDSVGKTLYQISKDENVCMDVLLETSTLQLFRGKRFDSRIAMMAPIDAPPCYDKAGQRLNAHDRTVYEPSEAISFVDIARRYNVCLQDLWQANPAMKSWGGAYYILPDIVFIPETDPCDFSSITFTTEPSQTLSAVSFLTNVCMNRLVEANPQYPQLASIGAMQGFNQVLTLSIPQRYPCYSLYQRETEYGYAYNSGRIFDYLCYSVPVTADSDFTGHTPAITASDDASLPYCEDRHNGMTVFYENVPYTLYKDIGSDTMITIGQCFDIDPYDLIALNAQNVPEVVRPEGWLLIPHPLDSTCPLLTDDRAVLSQYYTTLSYKAGYLIDGIYMVNYQDTLSSIGWTYGYLPQAIAETNGLTDPYTIYYLQELKMPPYPSLYTMVPVGGAGGVIVLVSTAIYGLRRWTRRRSNGKGKKKNEAA